MKQLLRNSTMGDSYTAPGHQEFYHPFQISYDSSFVSRLRCTLISDKRIDFGTGFHLRFTVVGRDMSSTCEATGLRPPPQQLRSSPQSALQRPLAKSDPPILDLLFAPSHSSLDQYLADIPPPLRPQKSANSFGSSREGGDSRDPAHQQSYGEQILPPATAVDSSTSSDGKRNDSKLVETASQQDPGPGWILPPPTFLEPKTYRASASDAMLPSPRLKDLQPHAASDPFELDSERGDTAWLPIQKPEAESSLAQGPKSSKWHAKDHEYSVLTRSTALTTPKSSFPSLTSETCSDDSMNTSFKDSSVSSPTTLYEKSHDPSFSVSSNCTRNKVYNTPYKSLRAGTNEAEGPQFGEKQFEEHIAKASPAASPGSSTAKSSSRAKCQEGRRHMSPPYGPGNMYENLWNLAPNSRPADFTNPFADPKSEFPTSCPTIPAKAIQLLGIHPEAQSPAMKSLPLTPQTKPNISFLSKISNRKTRNDTMLTRETSSAQTGRKSTSLRRIITAAFQPAGGKDITRSKLGR